VQLIAPYGREDLLIRIAAQLEHAMPWQARVPPLSVRNIAAPTAVRAARWERAATDHQDATAPAKPLPMRASAHRWTAGAFTRRRDADT
jgi:hypothetical protein